MEEDQSEKNDNVDHTSEDASQAHVTLFSIHEPNPFVIGVLFILVFLVLFLSA